MYRLNGYIMLKNIRNTNKVDTKSISWALYKIYHEDKQTMSAKIQ